MLNFPKPEGPYYIRENFTFLAKAFELMYDTGAINGFFFKSTDVLEVYMHDGTKRCFCTDSVYYWFLGFTQHVCPPLAGSASEAWQEGYQDSMLFKF